jgi:hypothetical protein
MEAAVRMYQRRLARNTEMGFGGEEDFVFFPQYSNREYALQTIRRQFEFILKEAKLKLDRSGKSRTTYSLRHTALMLRLLNAENIDIFMLARNALTSVDQLEGFYLSHVESRMKIRNLQSHSDLRKPGAKFNDQGL